MADLFLLIGRKEQAIDADFVKSKFNDSTTVASVQLPSYSPEKGMDRNEWINAHHQHGIDLVRVESMLKLRDVVLFTIPEPKDTHLGMLQIWNSPSSVYDIDAVRIPWSEVESDLKRRGEWTKAWKPDPRNNENGKNPTNFWYFSTLPAKQTSIPRIDGPSIVDPNMISSGLEVDLIKRVLNAHSLEGDNVYVWADDADIDDIRGICTSLNREFLSIPSGTPDERMPIPVVVESYPFSESTDNRTIDGSRAQTINRSKMVTIKAHIQDCREGLSALDNGQLSHGVTSPPYNIGYDPFNEPRPDSSGKLVTPIREGYEDSLSPEQYAYLLKSTFDRMDEKADPAGFELFLNIKSNYAGASCDLPFYMLGLMPERWHLLDVLIWRYDISFDPGRGKYKPLYEWVIRVGFGEVNLPSRGMMDWYIPILKGNSDERKGLKHPAMFPRDLVNRCVLESGREVKMVVDPFLGSGTTLAACLEMGVDAVGFEISEAFVSDIEQRFARVMHIGDGNVKQA